MSNEKEDLKEEIERLRREIRELREEVKVSCKECGERLSPRSLNRFGMCDKCVSKQEKERLDKEEAADRYPRLSRY